MTLRQTDAYSAGCKWKGMDVYGQQFTTMQGWFGSETAWNGMEWFHFRGMEWLHFFGWEKRRAEQIEVKLIICLKIVISNCK